MGYENTELAKSYNCGSVGYAPAVDHMGYFANRQVNDIVGSLRLTHFPLIKPGKSIGGRTELIPAMAAIEAV